MPIVDIDLVGGAPDGVSAAALARCIGDALGTPAGGLWVRLTRSSADAYGENGPAPEPLPVFVRVLAQLDDAAALPVQAQKVSTVVAHAVGRPRERVHVIFELDARGRVFFGGAPARG